MKDSQKCSSSLLNSLSLSLSFAVSHRVNTPQTHIAGSESLHPTVPVLWCRKHSQAEKHEMGNVGAAGGWWLTMSERGCSTEESSRRHFLGNQLPYMTFTSHYFIYISQSWGKSIKQVITQTFLSTDWKMDGSISNRYNKINELWRDGERLGLMDRWTMGGCPYHTQKAVKWKSWERGDWESKCQTLIDKQARVRKVKFSHGERKK